MLKLSSHQSVFLPWAGFWHKALHSDVMVIGSGMDFNKRDFEHRLQLHGAWSGLVLLKGSTKGPIATVQYEGAKQVAERLYRELDTKKYPHFSLVEPVLHFLYQNEYGYLADLNQQLIIRVATVLGLKTNFVFDSEIPTQETKTTRLLTRLQRHVKEPFEYLSGAGGRNYLEPLEFRHPTHYQEILTGAPPDTILQLIAKTPQPLTEIDRWFRWTT